MTSKDSPTPILDVRDLRVEYSKRAGAFGRVVGVHRAVDGVSLSLAAGESLGLVGESGSGKSTVGRAILRLVPAASGSVRFKGRDVLSASGAELRLLRRSMQVVFQDPGGSLNPRMRVVDIVAEPLHIHEIGRTGERRGMAIDLLARCGMPADAADRYRHQFSGGQKQRIAIARALALSPALLVCDEPTSALDVSVQAQILNLLLDLQRDLGLAYLFISHDIAVVNHMCSRIAVMREGRIVEEGPAERVLSSPEHEYTAKLVSAAHHV